MHKFMKYSEGYRRMTKTREVLLMSNGEYESAGNGNWGDRRSGQIRKKRHQRWRFERARARLVHQLESDEPFEIDGFDAFNARADGVEGFAVGGVSFFDGVFGDESVFFAFAREFASFIEGVSVFSEFCESDEVVLFVVDGDAGDNRDVLDGLNGEV